jgi:WD40 repeat protein
VAEFPGLPPLALSPDGSVLAHGDNDDARSRAAFPMIRMLGSARPARTRARGLGSATGLGAGPVAFSPDGKLLAAGMSSEQRGVVIEVRDVNSGQVRAALKPDYSGHDGFGIVQAIRFSPDARTLFLEDLGGYTRSEIIQCWDLSGASPRLVVQGPSESFAPEASRAAIAEFDPALLRDPATSENGAVEILELPAQQARLRLVRNGAIKATISPDGRILALPSNRSNQPDWQGIGAFVRYLLRAVGMLPAEPPVVNEIALREAATGRIIGTITRSIMGFPGPLTFSPDGTTLVVKELPWDSAQVSSANPMTDCTSSCGMFRPAGGPAGSTHWRQPWLQPRWCSPAPGSTGGGPAGPVIPRSMPLPRLPRGSSERRTSRWTRGIESSGGSRRSRGDSLGSRPVRCAARTPAFKRPRQPRRR